MQSIPKNSEGRFSSLFSLYRAYILASDVVLQTGEYRREGEDVGRVGDHPHVVEGGEHLAVHLMDLVDADFHQPLVGGGSPLHVDWEVDLNSLKPSEYPFVKSSLASHLDHKGREVDSRGGERVVPSRMVGLEKNPSGSLPIPLGAEVHQLNQPQETHASEVSGGVLALEPDLSPSTSSLIGFETTP